MDYTIETDNRDLNTTELLIMAGDVNKDNVHVELTVEVDPFELVQNAIDNLPEDISVSVQVLWDQFIERMKAYTEAPYDEDPSGRGE